MQNDTNNVKGEIEKIIQAHDRESPICKLNPDKKTVDRILNGLIKRKQRFGEFYCPCRIVTGNKKEDQKKICPCGWHEDEVRKDGICLCGLFVKK